ncbi:MAG: hypothetical protein JWM81_1145 [Candidatus Saccharibacteria bacterium]|nr:hypothetical protein [Candidatus Saccharibacteria bacterium]
MNVTLNNLLDAPCAIMFNADLLPHTGDGRTFMETSDTIADAVLATARNGALDPTVRVDRPVTKRPTLWVACPTWFDRDTSEIQAQCWITEIALPLRQYLSFLSLAESQLKTNSSEHFDKARLRTDGRALVLGELVLGKPAPMQNPELLAGYRLQ